MNSVYIVLNGRKLFQRASYFESFESFSYFESFESLSTEGNLIKVEEIGRQLRVYVKYTYVQYMYT